jgi:hypothetical protein
VADLGEQAANYLADRCSRAIPVRIRVSSSPDSSVSPWTCPAGSIGSEGLGVRDCPLLERAWGSSGDFLHGREHFRLIERAGNIKVEERVDILGRGALGHFLPCFVVWLRLEPQVPAEQLGQNPDLIGW